MCSNDLCLSQQRDAHHICKSDVHTPVDVVQGNVGDEEYTVVTPADGVLHVISASSTEKVEPFSEQGVPDILQLNDFSEQSLLHTLRLRYSKDDFYTFVGPILISINPYKWSNDLYSQERVNSYIGQHLVRSSCC